MVGRPRQIRPWRDRFAALEDPSYGSGGLSIGIPTSEREQRRRTHHTIGQRIGPARAKSYGSSTIGMKKSVVATTAWDALS